MAVAADVVDGVRVKRAQDDGSNYRASTSQLKQKHETVREESQARGCVQYHTVHGSEVEVNGTLWVSTILQCWMLVSTFGRQQHVQPPEKKALTSSLFAFTLRKERMRLLRRPSSCVSLSVFWFLARTGHGPHTQELRPHSCTAGVAGACLEDMRSGIETHRSTRRIWMVDTTTAGDEAKARFSWVRKMNSRILWMEECLTVIRGEQQYSFT